MPRKMNSRLDVLADHQRFQNIDQDFGTEMPVAFEAMVS